METQETDGNAYITVKEFLDSLGGRLSKNTVYQAIADGTIPSIRIGRRILLPADALNQMLQYSGEGNK